MTPYDCKSGDDVLFQAEDVVTNSSINIFEKSAEEINELFRVNGIEMVREMSEISGRPKTKKGRKDTHIEAPVDEL